MKTIFFFLVLTLTLSLNAQITKGNWLVGGNLDISTNESESSSNNSTQTFKANRININSNIGYFLADKLTIGLIPSFGWSNPEGSENSGIGYGLGPFVRYYYLKTEKRINLFSHVEYIYFNSFGNGKKISSSNEYTIKNGAAIFFNSSVAIEISLNYNNSKVDFESGSVSRFKDLNLGIGFQIHLEK